MKDMAGYWEIWAPYWSYLEDNMLDLESIDRLASLITNPVLVIGAGQGLLVEQLQKKGFEVDGIDIDPTMVMYAKKRRGINLIQADARKMPFADKSYKTSIMATGVVDFMDDEEQIELTIKEARRVTDDSGEVLVAFYGFHPKVEQLFKLVGVITDKGWNNKRMLDLFRLSPMQLIATIKKEGKISLLSAFLLTVKTQMSLPKKAKRSAKNLTKFWKQVDNPESLIDCTPDSIPYRNEEQIRKLFQNLNIPIHNIFVYDSCVVVHL